MRFRALAALLCLGLLSSRDPAEEPRYVQWGEQMLQQKKYDEAIRYFAAAARADSRDAAAYKGLGYAYAYKNDRSNALQYLRYALKLDPENSSLADYLAQLEGKPESTPSTPSPTENPPETNPWLMGGIVALCGTLMLAVF